MSNNITALKQAIALIEKLRGEVIEVGDSLVQISKAGREVNGNFANIKLPKELQSSLEANKTLIEQFNANAKERTRLEKSLQKAIAKRSEAESKVNKEIAKNRLESQLLSKILKDEAVLSSKLSSEYQKLSVRHRQAADSLKSFIAEGKRGNETQKQFNNRIRRSQREFNKLDARIRKADAAARQFNRNVGNYPKNIGILIRSLRSLAGAFGFTGGLFIMADILKKAAKTVREFDQAQADLAAVLGKSRDEIGLLTQQAKDLGATTAFTAAEVAKLQLELSKLGFSEGQILDATEGIENLAIATGVEAARAAKLAGAAIRGFGLEASEANRVAAALAVSTTKSASSFETLEVSLPKVSAIARAFGFTLEDTIALLGGLQNAGFEASIAGTSLRQIFLQLADANGELAQELGGPVKNFDDLIVKFKELDASGIDLARAFDLTNARSVAAFKTFLSTADSLKTLRDSVIDVEDELDTLANEKLNSLDGRLTLFNSAWEGFIINIEDGNNALSRFVNRAIDNASQALNDYTFALNDNVSFLDKWKIGTNVATRNLQRFVFQIEDANGLFSESVDKIKKDTAERNKNAAAIQAQANAFVELHGSFAPFTDDRAENQEEPFSLYTNEQTVNTVVRNLDFIDGEIARLKESQRGLIATDKEGIASISSKIKAYEKERNIILDNVKTKKKLIETNEKLNRVDAISFGSIGDEADKLEKGAKRIAEILESTNIDGQNIEIGIEAVSTVDNQELVDALQKDVDAHKKAQEEKTKYTKLSVEKQHELLGTLFSTFTDFYGLDLSAFSDIIDQKAAKEIDYASTVKSINNAILGGTLARYENEIRANQTRLDLVLNDENASEEEKEKAREVAAEKEREIRVKQAKAERDATLIQIAIDTAAAIVKATAQTGTLAPFVIPGIIAIGAAQAAFVASQPLPQFAEGVENFKGGKAVINDENGSKFREIVETPDGKLSVYKNRNAVVDLPTGSNVYSASDSIDLMNNLNRSILVSSFDSQQSTVDRALMMMSFNASFVGVEKKLDLLNKNMGKYAKRPNVVKNNVTIQPPRRTRI